MASNTVVVKVVADMSQFDREIDRARRELAALGPWWIRLELWLRGIGRRLRKDELVFLTAMCLAGGLLFDARRDLMWWAALCALVMTFRYAMKLFGLR